MFFEGQKYLVFYLVKTIDFFPFMISPIAISVFRKTFPIQRWDKYTFAFSYFFKFNCLLFMKFMLGIGY